MPRIAISYRRDDSAAITGRIFDRLAARYGTGSVFRDIDSIPLGVDFREYINRMLAETDITLVVVGKRWFGTRKGRRRIDDPADPVRVEVEMALRSRMPVVPVLVEGSAMPNIDQLPDSLKELVYRNGLHVDSGRDFDQHIERLIRNIEPILVRGAEAKRERAEAARQAEEEEQRTETGWRAAEEGRRAEAARRAEEEKQRAEAARLAEEEKRQVEAARLAEEEKQRAEVARLAEEEKRRAEAAAQAENERDSQAAWERPRGATKPSAKQLPKQSPWLKRRTQIVLSGAGVAPAAIALAVSHNHDDLFVVLVVVLVALATLYAIRSGRKWVPYVSAGLNPLLTAFWVWAVFFIPDRDKSLMCALFALTLLIESAVAFFNVRARGGFTAA